MCVCVAGYGRARGHRALRAHVATVLGDHRRERNRPAPQKDTRRHRRTIASQDLNFGLKSYGVGTLCPLSLLLI